MSGLRTVFAVAVLVVICSASSGADDRAKGALQGVWVGTSMQSNGKDIPAEALKWIRFTFKGDTLLIRGNFSDEREMACTYKIDPEQSPKHLDVTSDEHAVAILGIYETKGDELKICMRKESSDKGRPTEFVSTPDSDLVLVVLAKQKPKQSSKRSP